MWDFIFGQNDLRNKKLIWLWLASTNPNLYKRSIKKDDIISLKIPNLCDQIWQSITKNNDDGYRFNAISHLVKGTCLVHKAQVDDLYSRTTSLFRFQSAFSRSNSFDDTSDFESNRFGKYKTSKRPRSKSFATVDSHSLLEETEDVRSFLIPTEDNIISTSAREQDVTLKDYVNESRAEEELDEFFDFGELEHQEKIHFLDLLTDKNVENNVSHSKPVKILDVSCLHNKLAEPSSNDDLDVSIDIARYNGDENISITELNHPEDFNSSRASIGYERLIDKNGNITSQDSIVDINSIANLSIENAALPENTSICDLNTNNSCNNNSIEKGTKRRIENNENISKDKKRFKKLKIDKSIELTIEQIKQIIADLSNLKCTNPRDDAVSEHTRCFKTTNTLFSNPCKRLPLPLFQYYKKNLKRANSDNDHSIMCQHLNNEEISESFGENCLPFKKRKSNQIEIIDQIIIPPYLPNNNLNTGEDILDENNILLNEIIQDLAQEHENSQNETESLINESNIKFYQAKKQIHDNWNKVAVLKKLSHLWKTNVESIDMKKLCENASKRAAAVAFYSVLELAAGKYISIKKDENTNYIINIEKGDKFNKNLNNENN